MTTRDLIRSEIEHVRDEDLEELYQVVRRFKDARTVSPERSLMAKLQDVKIEAPPDFAANLDQYVSGEKRAREHVEGPMDYGP